MSSEPATNHILSVDDERAIIDNLAPLLGRAGFAVVVAAHGVEALDRVEKRAPDLVALDVLMPKMDVRQVVRQLREQGNWTLASGLCCVGVLRPRGRNRWRWPRD